MGWLTARDVLTFDLPERATLERFHAPGYVAALEQAVDGRQVTAAERAEFGFGTMENPVFPGLFDRARATVGGSIAAANAALGGAVAFHPAGGTHHGRPGRASGFCYFNDPAFAIATFLDAEAAPVLYLDLDAHHGDGVEALFADDARVTLISIHEQGRWPHTADRPGEGPANAINIPVPRGFTDDELMWLIDACEENVVARVKPSAIVVTAGADCLRGDPLSAMEVSNRAWWRAVARAVEWAPHAVVVGGGGYNPWTVARGWAGLWAVLAGRDANSPLTSRAARILAGFSSDLVDEDEIEGEWLSAIADAPRPGGIREAVKQAAHLALRKRIFRLA